MMELISITRIDVLNSKIPNFKLSYLKVTKDSVPHFNSYLDQKRARRRRTNEKEVGDSPKT